ncbi:FAD/NAD(P)-binding protein [Micavibrio aeruginosavorus]|uniref:FAD/NAD(P)-binding protein n=1 Tax=Micavibrio aeruginosavorus TaxID=349221 RepID=UPI003F4AA823
MLNLPPDLDPAYVEPMKTGADQNQTPPIIAIIGGGQCGTIALHDILFHFEKLKAENAATPAPKIVWVDAQGAFGQCGAFSTAQPDCLLTSGPAYALKPSLCAPDLFTRYYIDNHNATDLNTCVPRRIYGEFMADLTHDVMHRVMAAGMDIQTITARVESITRDDHGILILQTDAGETMNVHQAITSPGPSRNTAMDHLNGKTGFIANPSDIASVRASNLDFNDPKSTIVCFGPGNSFFDGINLLEKELGYRGKYILVNASGRTPWAVGPDLEDYDGLPYHFNHFAPESMPNRVSFAKLKAALDRDLEDLKDPEKNPRGFGPEYPIYYIAAYGMQYFKSWADHHKPDTLTKGQAEIAFQQLQDDAMMQLKCISAPDDIALYQDLRAQGRLFESHGRILIDQIKQDERGFSVPIRSHLDQALYNVRVSGFMNCKPYHSNWDTPVKDPPGHLLRQMEREELIRRPPSGYGGGAGHGERYDTSHARDNGISVVGSSMSPIWGVHLSAAQINIAARNALNGAIRAVQDGPSSDPSSNFGAGFGSMAY